MPSRFARPAAPCNGGMDVRGAARKQPAFIVWGFPREGQTHSAKNAKPLLTTIHPFLVTLGGPARMREWRSGFPTVLRGAGCARGPQTVDRQPGSACNCDVPRSG